MVFTLANGSSPSVAFLHVVCGPLPRKSGEVAQGYFWKIGNGLRLNAIVGNVGAPVVNEGGKPRALNRIGIFFRCRDQRIECEKERKRLLIGGHSVSGVAAILPKSRLLN